MKTFSSLPKCVRTLECVREDGNQGQKNNYQC